MQQVNDLKAHWAQMNGSKGDIITRTEQYAAWTVPTVCPMNEEDGKEQTRGNVAIGARLVAHLANKIADTMFPSDKPFFTLPLKPEADRRLSEEFADEVEKAKMVLQITKATADVAKDAMRNLNLTAYRPVAVEAIKGAIVAGNALIHRLPDDTRVTYNLKDFCVTRGVAGNLTSVLLRDAKKFSNLTADQQRAVGGNSDRNNDATVDVYTFYWLHGGRWQRVQGLDNILLEDTRKSYSMKEFPVLDITWNLSRGETYGRGLVEENVVLFSNVDVTTAAILDTIGILADIKFLVNPASMIDLAELNASERGSYHAGSKDDIWPVEFKHTTELKLLMEQVSEWSRMLAQAFLLGTGSTRDAERVTAEEIRLNARELESAFGGLYSKLALNWQQKEAEYLIHTMDLSERGLEEFDVAVSTGLESLSREGQLDALRLAIGDLQMLDAVPEDVRGTLDVRAFAEFVFVNRGVNLAQFVLSQEQLQKKQQAEMAQQEAMMASQGASNVAEQTAINASKGQ